MQDHNETRGRLTGLGLLATFVALQANASEENGAGELADAAEGQANVTEIIVTGSRIPRVDIDSPSPVTVLSREMFEQVGDTNVIRELNKVPQFFGGQGPTASQSFSGSYVDLRGLHPKRTLTLVNGRRYISTISDSIPDVSSIPPELIARVEVLTGGASATYGSDAVAGVVNFILRDDIEGIEFGAQYGATSRGEPSTQRYSMTTGSRFDDDRGRAYLNLAYDEGEQIFAGRRRYANTTLVNSDGQLIGSGSTYVPAGVVEIDGQLATFDANGELFSAPGVINALSEQQRFDLAPYMPLQESSKSSSVHAGLNYSITEAVSLYTEVALLHGETHLEGPPAAVDIPFLVNVDNPYLGPLTRDYLSAFADENGLVELPGFRKRFVEMGTGGSRTPRSSYRIVLGTNVELPGDWTLDGYYLTQRSRFEIEARNAVSFYALEQALRATTDDAGNIVCVDQKLNCVPVNPFGADKITAEQARFIRAAPFLSGLNTDTVFALTATGTAVELPAGPLGVSIGAEHLRLYAEEIPNEAYLLGATSDGAFALLKGVNKSKQFFGEINVPLLRDRSFFHYLGFQGGLRYSDFDSSGGATTYKALLEWAPVRGVKLRGGIQHAIREATVFERFAGDVFFETLERDPCFTGAPLSGALRDACIASGLSAALADAGVSPREVEYRQRDVASPDLEPEEAESITVGLVLDSLWIDGLSATVDYYDIEIEGSIEDMGSDLIVRQCLEFAAAESRPFCDFITRDPVTGSVTQIDNFRLNTGRLRRSGIDLGVVYPFEVGGGMLRVSVNALYQLEFSLLPTEVTPEAEFDCVGFYGPNCTRDGGVVPRWQTYTSFDWRHGPFGVGLTWQRIGHARDILTKEDPAQAQALLARTSVPSVNYFDLSFSWRTTESLELYGGVDNVLNEEPPIVGSDRGDFANTYPAQYDLIGRRFYMGARYKF